MQGGEVTNEAPKSNKGTSRIMWGVKWSREQRRRQLSARITLQKTMEIAVGDEHMIKPRVKCGMQHARLPYQPKGAYGVEAIEPEQV